MMNKFMLGLLVGGAATLVAYLSKKTEKKYITVEETTDSGETVVGQKEVEEPVLTKEKIKAAFSKENIKKKSEKVMNYIVKNQEKIQAITVCFGLMSAVLNFRTAFNNSKKSNEISRTALSLMEQVADSCCA